MSKATSQYRYLAAKSGPITFIVCYSLAVLMPLIIVRLLGLEHESIKREFALGFGMIGLMFFLSSFWLSGRFKWITAKRGVDLMLKFHRRIVTFGLLFSLIHAVMILGSAMPDYLSLVIFAFFTIVLQFILAKKKSKLKVKYEYWRLSHGVLAMLLVTSLTAHAIIEGSYSAHPVLSAYWIVLTVLAVLSLFYVHNYLPYQESKRPYKVVEIVEEAHQQWRVTIEPQGFEAMNFEAGQYAFVSFGDSPFSDRAHPFSFSSCPADRPKISFTIKELGDFTNTMKGIDVGSNVFLYGPYGHLTLNNRRGPKTKEKGVVLLAGGIGITPMISMLRDMQARNYQLPVKLLYASRSQEELLYKEELIQLSEKLDLDLHLVISEASDDWCGEIGRIDENYLKNHINFNQYQEYLYFTCGTSSFVNSTVKGLEAVGGIPMFNIVFEDFSVYS